MSDLVIKDLISNLLQPAEEDDKTGEAIQGLTKALQAGLKSVGNDIKAAAKISQPAASPAASRWVFRIIRDKKGAIEAIVAERGSSDVNL